MTVGEGILVKGGCVIDPASGLDGRADLRLAGGRVVETGAALEPKPGERVIEARGRLVTPGLVDLHVHLRDPGQTARETIATGAAAATAGGFTTVCAMPNTEPVTDTPERVRDVIERGLAAATARVLPIGAVSIGSRGETLTDVHALARAGVVAVSDDGLPVATGDLLAAALVAAREAGVVVADHCEDRRLSAGGAVHADAAERLEVGGIPADAETRAVARDLEVLSRSGGRLHVCHVSTAGSVELLRQARRSGLAVTAEVTPHHLTLTHEAVAELGACGKMNPPLASEEDREAVLGGLLDGTIDCVATDHAPHTERDKARGLAAAPFGVIGLETAFSVLYTELVRSGRMALGVLVDRLTTAPARVFGLGVGRLDPGAPGDVAVFDLDVDWVVDPAALRSRGRNTPWAGRRLSGRPVLTIVEGRVVHDLLSPVLPPG